MLPASLLCALVAVAQPAPKVIPLWAGKAPHAVGEADADVPLLTAYQAPAGKATGAAVVVCPGGGYGALAMDHEGKQVAEFFNGLGVHAFVLKYRIVAKGRPGPLGEAPLADVNRAVRTVRSLAGESGFDPKRVGLMGFSAGGHLASTGGTHFDAGKPGGDEVDAQSSRPDFLILGYPVVTMQDGVTHAGSKRNLLGANPPAEQVERFSNEKQVTKDTPPTFIFQTNEDVPVPAENAVRFYLALRQAKVPAELHVYEKGQHGVGINPKTGTPTDTWKDRLADWLAVRGVAAKR